MPNMTQGDRIRELEMTVASQSTQQEISNKTSDTLSQTLQETIHKLEETRRELEKKIAVLEEKVSKLESAQYRVGERLWLVIAPLFAAVIGSVLTWLLTRTTP